MPLHAGQLFGTTCPSLGWTPKSNNTLFIYLSQYFEETTLLFKTDVQESECVDEEVSFDLSVELGIRVKTRGVVHFEKVGLRLAIIFSPRVDNHIKSENLEAHCVKDIARLAGPVVMNQVRLYWDERFYDNIIDLLMQQLYIKVISIF